jgi:circadian clock protein KaiB
MAERRKSRKVSSTREFEAAMANEAKQKYVLKLYVTGMTQRSREAISNISKVLGEHLGDNYELEVIDIYQQPSLAKGDQIIAVPTLIRRLPLPIRRLIGDLSKEDRIVLGLDLKPKPDPVKKEVMRPKDE